jgi:outer membrane lipoprotein-sorting protein
MKRHGIAGWFTISCGMAFSVAAVLAARAQSPAAAPAAAPAPSQNSQTQKLTEQQFKNIQILKGLPADQLIPAMQFIAASLGVDCEFCHDHQHMDSDDKKPKKIARKMMTMMFDIDKANFDGQLHVTCYTCHRGSAMPVGIPVIKDEEPAAAEGKKPAENVALPKAEDLLDKYLAAVGGAAAVEKITTRTERGKLTTFDGQTFTADVYSKSPDKRISYMHLPSGDSVTGFDGQRGWLSFPGRPAHMTSAAENDSMRLDADLHFAADVKSLYPKFTVAPGEKIDGHDTYLVEGHAEGRPPLRLYLDEQSGLLLRMVRYVQSPLGLNPTQVDYADYRESDGVKVPFRWTVARPGNRFTIQVENLQQNTPIDDSRFTPPPPPPPPPAASAPPAKP